MFDKRFKTQSATGYRPPRWKRTGRVGRLGVNSAQPRARSSGGRDSSAALLARGKEQISCSSSGQVLASRSGWFLVSAREGASAVRACGHLGDRQRPPGVRRPEMPTGSKVLCADINALTPEQLHGFAGEHPFPSPAKEGAEVSSCVVWVISAHVGAVSRRARCRGAAGRSASRCRNWAGTRRCRSKARPRRGRDQASRNSMPPLSRDANEATLRPSGAGSRSGEWNTRAFEGGDTWSWSRGGLG